MNTRLSRRFPFLAWSVLFPVVLLSSCQGDGTGLTSSGMPEGELGFAAQIQPIFDTYCTGCHTPGGLGYIDTGGNESNGLVLSIGNSYRALVGQPTFQRPSTEPKFRVVPGDPDASYIMQKILSAAPKEGVRMPTKGPPWVSKYEVELIRAWIKVGANLN